MGDTQEINKAAARRLYEEAISQGKVEVLNDIVADDARDTAAPVDGGLPSGRGGFIRHVTWLLQAVEGVKATVTDTIAEDDRVVVYWTIDGIQREEVFGVPNSDGPKLFEWSNATVGEDDPELRVSDDYMRQRIIEMATYAAQLWQQRLAEERHARQATSGGSDGWIVPDKTAPPGGVSGAVLSGTIPLGGQGVRRRRVAAPRARAATAKATTTARSRHTSPVAVLPTRVCMASVA